MEVVPSPRPTVSPLRPFVAAALAAIALVATGALAFGSAAVRFRDAAALNSFELLGSSLGIQSEANLVGHLADPLPIGLLLGALLGVALLRGRPRTAGVVAVAVLGASLTTQILKPALADPRLSGLVGGDRILAGSWPSGHSTAAMSIALCAVLVSSSRWRPAVGIAGAAFAVAVGYSLLAVAWHFPSDVLGGYLVAAMWVAAGAGALRAADQRWPARTGREAAVRLRDALAPSGVAVGAATAVALAAVLLRPGAVLEEALRHTTMVASGLAVAALGLSVATGLVLALRR